MADKKEAAKEKKSYSISGMYENGKSKNKTCPKCGPGIFLANHKDRVSCGKCGYTEKK
jgi:small subunit ribosomal protein S27Ae